MVKAKVNYFIEILMLLCFIGVAITSMLLEENRNLTFLHHVLGIVLLAFIALHILLHFKFIIAMTKSLFKRIN